MLATYVCAKLIQLRPTLCDTWNVDHQGPLSMGFSGQEYWSGLPFPPLGDLLNPGIEPAPLMSLALAGRFFITSTTYVWAIIQCRSIYLDVMDIMWSESGVYEGRYLFT